jgi:plasmid maintenance system antidote protein VapI
LRLSAASGNSAEFWMRLQSDYDLETALDNLGVRQLKDVTPVKV